MSLRPAISAKNRLNENGESGTNAFARNKSVFKKPLLIRMEYAFSSKTPLRTAELLSPIRSPKGFRNNFAATKIPLLRVDL